MVSGLTDIRPNPAHNSVHSCFHFGLFLSWFHESRPANSIKDYRRNRNLKVLLIAAPFSRRQFFVRMNGNHWPKEGRPVSLTRVLTALRKSLAKSGP